MSVLTVDLKSTLMKYAEPIKVRKNSYLFRTGDPIDYIYLIEQGTVKLTSHESQGADKFSGIYSDNEFIWDNVFEGDKHLCNCICQTSLSCVRITISDFEKLLKKSSFAGELIAFYSKELHIKGEKVSYLLKENALSRIAGYILLREEERTGLFIENTLDEISDNVCLRMETVSRKLRELEREGIIKRRGKGKLTVVDVMKLQEIYNEP